MGFCDTNFSSSAASDVGDVCQLRRRPSGANFALSLAPPLLPLLRPLLTLVINGQPEEGDVAARACNHSLSAYTPEYFEKPYSKY